MDRRTVLGLIATAGIAGVFGATPVRASGSTAAVATALNLAGRQRMLAQRLAKAWLMVGLNISPVRARALLDESRVTQQKDFLSLLDFAASHNVHPPLADLGRQWAAYLATLGAKPSRDNAQSVYDASEAVSRSAHALVLACERISGTPARDRIINIAGRQRMLSQRMAKFMLFKAWDINARAAQMEANFSRAEFSSGMHQLFLNVGDMQETRKLLEEMDRMWLEYRTLMDRQLDNPELGRRLPRIVDLSEEILAQCERLVVALERSITGQKAGVPAATT